MQYYLVHFLLYCKEVQASGIQGDYHTRNNQWNDVWYWNRYVCVVVKGVCT